MLLKSGLIQDTDNQAELSVSLLVSELIPSFRRFVSVKWNWKLGGARRSVSSSPLLSTAAIVAPYFRVQLQLAFQFRRGCSAYSSSPTR